MLELLNDTVQLDPDLMMYPEFRVLWERDKTPQKRIAWAFIQYVFHFCNPKSIFDAYSEEVKKQKIIERYFPADLKDYEIYADQELVKCMHFYKEYLGLSTFRLALDAVKRTIEEITLELRSSRAKLPSKLTNITRLNKAIEEPRKMEATVDEDELQQARVKGKDRHIKKRERG